MRKKKPSKKRRVISKSVNKMATKKRRKRSVSTSVSRPAKKRRATRRRSRGMFDGAGKNLMATVKPVLAGAAGGTTYGVAGGLVSENVRPWAALAVSVVSVFAGMNHFGAGVAGAAAFDYTRKTFGLAEDMDATEYVNPTILSDAYELSERETMDENGNVYALSDNGASWEYVGTIPTQSVSLDPLYTM